MKKSVVLLSGGLDSTTCLSIALNEGREVYPLTFFYGQKHKIELENSKAVINYYGVKNHRVINIENVGGSALTDENISVPNYIKSDDIPVTYVPARNIIFLSYAVGYAEVVGAEDIYIGVNAVDYSGYPDCRPEFIEGFRNVVKLGTKRGVAGNPVKILTPLIYLRKAEIIKLAYENNAPLHLTSSCYRGRKKACGTCDSCVLRLKGFREAGLIDPIDYEKN